MPIVRRRVPAAPSPAKSAQDLRLFAERTRLFQCRLQTSYEPICRFSGPHQARYLFKKESRPNSPSDAVITLAREKKKAIYQYVTQITVVYLQSIPPFDNTNAVKATTMEIAWCDRRRCNEDGHFKFGKKTERRGRSISTETGSRPFG